MYCIGLFFCSFLYNSGYKFFGVNTMPKYKEQLHTNGFCVIPDIISQDLVQQLRNKYLYQLSNDKRMLTAQDILDNSDLYNVLFSEDVINIISNILGSSYCIYPDFTLRRSVYVAWHVDVPYLSQAEANSDICANMLQVSLYLQDNTPENGGGLDAISGSHHYTDIDPQNLDLSGVDFSKQIQIPSLAGSLTIWDSRLIHKSSVPINDKPTEAKLALQWTISRTGKFANHYLNFLSDRIHAKLKDPIYDKTNREMEHLLSIAKLRYPDSFNDEQIAVIEKHGLQFKLLK